MFKGIVSIGSLAYLKSNKFTKMILRNCLSYMAMNRSSYSEVFFGMGVLKICSKFTGEHPSRSVISIKLLCNFIEISLRHECSPANMLHIFRTPFLRNTSGWLLLTLIFFFFKCLFTITKENYHSLL